MSKCYILMAGPEEPVGVFNSWLYGMAWKQSAQVAKIDGASLKSW